MKLSDYPTAIAHLQRQVFSHDQNLNSLLEAVKVFEAGFDKEVAFDLTLKNDTQRKARRVELQQESADYLQVSQLLKQTKEKRELLAIELELTRNQFVVLKLERREAIARLEVQTAA